jgi:hypothetical protein
VLDHSSNTSAADQMSRAEAALMVACGKDHGNWYVLEHGKASTVDHESWLYWGDEINRPLLARSFPPLMLITL